MGIKSWLRHSDAPPAAPRRLCWCYVPLKIVESLIIRKMRRCLLNIRSYILTALIALTFSSVAQSQPADEAAAVFQHFLASFTNSDADSIVELFSEDAMFWGTGSQTLVKDTAGIRQYFSELGRRPPGQRIASALEYSVLELSANDVLVSGMWQVMPAGQTSGTPLRVSMALSLRNGEWKIVQFHNSRVPE